MKKLTAILLVLVMLFSLSAAAMADEGAGDAAKTDSDSKTMSFITAFRSVRANHWEFQIHKVGDLNLAVWIPEQLEEQTDKPEDSYLLFADEKASVNVHRVGLDAGTSLEDVEKTITDQGNESAGIYWINGFNVLVYHSNDDALNAVILGEEGDAVEFVMKPVSDENYNSLLSTVMCTIQPSTLHVEDAALMMDADLNITWGENKHVTYAEDGTGITVNMWDKEVTADTISNVNNWDSVKQDKIDTYNIYADTLAVFGMDKDVELVLQYTSPDEQTSFLTIDNGEVTYDVFAK